MSAGQVLGANIRAFREQRGLSLSELARRSSIAKGTLSQLESGSGNPTIETVFSLSNALDVPVSELVTARTPPDVVLVRARDVEVLSSNTVDLRLMRRMDIADTVIEIYDQRVRPGTTQTTDGHPGKEHVLVTSGRLRVGPIEEPYELGPGDYVCFPGSIPHLYETIEGEVSSVLVLEYPKH